MQVKTEVRMKNIIFAFVVSVVLMTGNVLANSYYSGKWYPKYEMQIIVDGHPLREYWHESRCFVAGMIDKKYAIRVKNNTNKRVEVVVSVDGRDVLDGKEADYVTKRGYVLSPYQSYDIPGFRLSFKEVASFTFSTVENSYAYKMGNANNVGVIGAAFFPEKPKPVIKPQPFVPQYDYYFQGNGAGGYYSRGKSEKKEPAAGAPPASTQSMESLRSGADAEKSAGEIIPMEPDITKEPKRQGLGTAFGESAKSEVVTTKFKRLNSSSPEALLTIYYNDTKGLSAMGINIVDEQVTYEEINKRKNANPFPKTNFSTPPPGWTPYDP
jgi:hypothetical protein